MNTTSASDVIVAIAAIGGLALPIAYLLERTNRRDRREHGRRTSWTTAPHDADARRIADELAALGGGRHA